jgi:hypothetical protein
MATSDIRNTILQVITEKSAQNRGNLQSTSVLSDVAQRLQLGSKSEDQQALLTAFHDLFRTGYLAWGFNLVNPSPPFFHVCEQGRRSLRNYSRDPANPDGYRANLQAIATLPPIADSYIREGLDCYVADLPKAAAVMVGAAAESLVLDLRDSIIGRITALGHSVPKGLNDWKAKTVIDAINAFLATQKNAIPHGLRESADGYWPAFTQQIRAARNDAGHPSSIDPVTIDTVHASLLIFPELAKLWSELSAWVTTQYK